MHYSKKTLLLVEDEAVVALMEASQLGSAGYDVIHVTSGVKAIETVRDADTQVDLILMDVDLGNGMDGIDAAREILETHNLPVVFLSSHTEKVIVDKTEAVTSYGYVVKNSGEVALRASIRMAFKLFEANRSIAEQNMQLEAANEELRSTNESLQQFQQALLVERERAEWWHDLMRYVVRYDPSAIAILDDKLHFMYVSQRFVEDYRVEGSSIIGRHHYEVFPEIPQKWRDVHQRALHGETLRAEDDFFVRPDGDVDFTRWECRPWYRAGGAIGGIILYTEVLNRRKRIESELHRSEQRFRSIMDSMHDVVFTLDSNSRHTAVYGKWVSEPGLSAEHFIGKTSAEMLGEEAAAVHQQACDHALTGEFTVYNWSIPTDEGPRHFQTSLSPIFAEDGTVDGLVGIGRDITELLQMKEAVRKTDALQAAVVAASPHPIVSVDRDGKVLSWNPAAERVFGWRREQVLGHPLPVVPQEYSEQFAALRQRVTQGEILSSIELTRETSTGRLLQISLSAAPIRDPDKQVIGIMAFMEDITERKRAERLAAGRNAVLRGILESSPFSIFSLDCEYRYTSFNEVHARTMKALYAADIELGHSLYEYQTVEEDRSRSQPNLDRALRGEQFTDEAYSGSERLSRVYVEVTHTPIRNPEGRVIGVAVFARNVSERKAAQQRIEALLREKELRLKETHHHIKNNMNTIQSLLLLQASNCSRSRSQTVLRDAAGRLQSMSLLYDQLYRSDSHRELNARDYIPKLVQQIINVFEGFTPVQTGVNVENVVLQVATLSAIGIIVNELITNSMKYAFADTGNPMIDVTLAKADGLVVLQYTDNGSGLPETISFKNSSGFGMQLVGLLVQQLGAAARIERDRGTRFVFEFEA